MFPSTLSTFNRPSPTDRLNSPSHSALHNTVSSALGQVEAVIGVDGANSVVGTLQYLIKSPASDGGGHVQSANKGGTGQTTYTKGDLLVASSSSVLTKLATGISGQTLLVNTTTASGVEWGQPSGIPTSVLTLIPRPPLGGRLEAGQGQTTFTSPSVANVWQVPIDFPIRASILTVMAGDVVGASGTLDFTLYRENGSSSVFSLTTPTVSTAYTIYRAYFPSVLAIEPGNYYALANTNAAASVDMAGWSIGSSVLSRLGNVASSPVVQGTYAITGGTPPPSIVTTAITSVVAGQGNNLFFRLDG